MPEHLSYPFCHVYSSALVHQRPRGKDSMRSCGYVDTDCAAAVHRVVPLVHPLPSFQHSKHPPQVRTCSDQVDLKQQAIKVVLEALAEGALKTEIAAFYVKAESYAHMETEARKKKAEYDTKYHSTPSRRKYRGILGAINRKVGKIGDGKDVAHQSKKKYILQLASKNRADKKHIFFK